MKKAYGLKELLEDYGIDEEQMMRDSLFDGCCPGICIECGYTTDIEPDSQDGWCEECNKNTIHSGLTLLGVI